jgi:hypothetical protein
MIASTSHTATMSPKPECHGRRPCPCCPRRCNRSPADAFSA